MRWGGVGASSGCFGVSGRLNRSRVEVGVPRLVGRVIGS